MLPEHAYLDGPDARSPAVGLPSNHPVHEPAAVEHDLEQGIRDLMYRIRQAEFGGAAGAIHRELWRLLDPTLSDSAAVYRGTPHEIARPTFELSELGRKAGKP